MNLSVGLAVIFSLLHFVSANNLGTLKTYQRHACDQSSLSLHCPTHTTIDIFFANYGRPAPSTPSDRSNRDKPPYDLCPPIPGVHGPPQECVMPEAKHEIVQRVVRDCQHKQSCRLQVLPETFLNQDPCPSTRKYVEVAYKCRPATFINKVVCEGEEQSLRCEANSRLAIYSVLFGRTLQGNIRCPQPENAPQEECQDTFATEVVMKSCQGKRSCHLVAQADRFKKRPCSSESRVYLKTVYTCVPRSILKESFQSVLETDETPNLEEPTPSQPLNTLPPTSALPPKMSPPHPSNSIHSDGNPRGHQKHYSPLDPTQRSSLPFFNPTVRPLGKKKIDELSYRQHDQQHLPDSSPDLINCTVTILSGSKDSKVGFITDWMRTVGFVTRNFEKFTLYLIVGFFCGLVVLLTVVVGRLTVEKRRTKAHEKTNSDQLTSVFSAEDVDANLDLTAPIGCSTMSRAGGGTHSPDDRASSPLPLPEVVRYNTTPRGIVTVRRQESDIILPPRSLSRTNNNQLFYS